MSQTKSKSKTAQQWSTDPWPRVEAAVRQRWQHVGEEELHSLPCDRDAVEDFLDEFTESTREEIESVVREFAPQPSVTQQVSHLSEHVSERVVPPLTSAFDRVRYEADEHPGTLTGLAFVTGITIGVIGTLAYCNSRPQPSAYQNLLPNRWF